MNRLIEVFLVRLTTMSRMELGQFEVPCDWGADTICNFYEKRESCMIDAGWDIGFRIVEDCQGVE